MNRVLRKRLLRDLKHNFLRNLALVLMIVMGMYVVVSIVGAADTIIVGSTHKAEENHVENGQFGVFLPLTDAQEKELTETGIALEKMFSMDLEAEDGSVVRLMKNREKINLIDLDEGNLAKDSGEVVLEKRYCEEHGLKTGDSITIDDLKFEITGIGSTPDYDMPIQTFSDMAVESTRFGTGFVTEEQYEEMKEKRISKAEDYCYAYRLNDSGMTDDEVKWIVKEFDIEYAGVKAVSFQEMISDTIGKNLTSFVKKADNPRIYAAMGDMQINKEAGLFAGVIIMILFTYVISVFVIHQIQQESSVVGTLYALGAKKRDLLIHYITLPAILTLIGGVIGSLLGFSKIGIPTQTANSYQYFSIPKLDVCYSVYLIIYSMVMPPVVSVIVNYLVINKRLSQTALSLIRKEQSSKRKPMDQLCALRCAERERTMLQSSTCASELVPSFHEAFVSKAIWGTSMKGITKLKNIWTGDFKICTEQCEKQAFFHLGRMKFLRCFQLRQMMRERRTGFTVVCGMMISLLVLMLGLNCYVLCGNVQKDTRNSTRFEYMYFLKYPIKEVPEGGEACYVESLSKTALGYTLNVSVIGIDEDNKYYGTEPVKGKNNLTISKSVQQKYGLHIGEQLTLTDDAEDTDYTFTVKEICDYAGGLTVFMDIDCMRELFGQEEDYYNMLLSNKELSIDESRIYSITTREDAEHSASIFTSLMMPLVILMIVAAVIIFCMVLYLMMGVMIDRSSFGISLVQVFGFRTGEIKKIYLNGNTWIVAVGAVVGIPFAKIIMDALYPWMIANAAVGMNLEFPWYLYAEIFVGAMTVYFVVNTLLVWKLKRITPEEVLKNRE